ncbi:radical SAM/SPASM domain-containing protein [Thermodesulfobacteriota bacterium]
MNVYPAQPVNLGGPAMLPAVSKLAWRAFVLLFNRENRAARRDKGVSSGDAFFNFARLSFLENVLLKYRHPVKFGEQVVLDSTFPPFPSPACDRRLSNYMNNLDITELPSGIVSVSTTNSCPYACSFCSTNALRKTETDLDEDLVKRVISQIEDLGVPLIILHGGEPMYRYDRFLRLVKHVSNDTCLWMFSTGYGVTEERARELRENGLFGVWISLDHYEPEYNNRLRGHPEAFDNACRAVEHFRKAGIYTCLSLVPPDDFENTENFKKYYEMAKEMGVAEIRVMEKKPSGREACRGVTPHSPILEQLQKDLYKNPAYKDYPPWSGLSTWLEKDNAFGCQCRFEYLFVTSTGDVQPCEASEISFGNVKDEEFRDIYDRTRKVFNRPSTGCIPMVMYDEIREYQKVKETMSSQEKAEVATRIMQGFIRKGKLPGVHKPLINVYRKRLQAFYSRRARRAGVTEQAVQPVDAAESGRAG